ncbi:MAG: SpoIIE family protein phosphatase [bacterium]|nr:SpoIIE family protein phosphatase [bacterium]
MRRIKLNTLFFSCVLLLIGIIYCIVYFTFTDVYLTFRSEVINRTTKNLKQFIDIDLINDTRRQLLSINRNLKNTTNHLQFFSKKINSYNLDSVIEDRLTLKFNKKADLYQYTDPKSYLSVKGIPYGLIINSFSDKFINETKHKSSKLRELLPLLQQTCDHDYIDGVFVLLKDKLLLEYINNPDKYQSLYKKQYLNNFYIQTFNMGIKPGEPYFSRIYRDRTKKMEIAIIYPLFNSQKKLYGVVGFYYSYKYIIDRGNEIFSNSKSKHYDVIRFFVDNKNNILYLPIESAKLLSFPCNPKNDSIRNVNIFSSSNKNVKNLGKLISSRDSGAKHIVINGVRYVLVFYEIPISKWTLVFLVKDFDLYKNLYFLSGSYNDIFQKFMEYFLFGLITALLAGLIIFFILLKFIFIIPIEKLRDKFKLLGKGNFNISLKEAGVKEIHDLAKSFNILGYQLKDFTKNLADEVKSKQAIVTELEIAGEIQTSVLPDITNEFIREEFDLYAKVVSSKEMSGDFYDFFFINKGERLAFIVADVSGKGVTAAFFMSMAKAIIKESCLTHETNSPGELLTRINKVLCIDNKKSMFLTMYLGFYNIKTGELDYANAGHHEFICLDNNVTDSTLGMLGDPAIGLVEHITFKTGSLRLEQGSSLIFYTDGISEAPDSNDIEYGADNIEKIIIKNCQCSLNELGDAIINDVLEFQNGEKFDDITLLMLKREK